MSPFAMRPWVALVGPEIEENLSLRYLASSLAKAGFRSELVSFNSERDFGLALAAVLSAEVPPLVVGVSLSFQWRAADFLALVVALREGGYRGHITTGGHFATFASREILADFPELDSVCRQESEETMVALCRALVSGQPLGAVPGLALPDGKGGAVLTGEAKLPDLATLPRPDRRGEPARCFGHGIAPLVASRGCYANCSFCCIAAWHEQSLPGKRYRLREVGDVADEMCAMQRERGVDIFVFHDDNFFLPGHRKNFERLGALANALEKRGIGPFATVVKARPTDVDPSVFRLLKERLACIRCYVGVESDADQGLDTLRRWANSKQNHAAIAVARELDLYVCFNLLMFDPDTTIESVRTNVAFLKYAAEMPSNFGRVELYAGTPLLARMQSEGRCRGDYMAWDYSLASPDIERVFALSMRCFEARNFGPDALANRIMATRFDLEVARHFHPDLSDPNWLAEGKHLSSSLSLGTAAGLEAICNHVEAGAPARDDAAFVRELSATLRAEETRIAQGARDLAAAVTSALGRGRPLTELGDRVATPLQRAANVSLEVTP